MAALDSKAAFTARCNAVGLSEDNQKILREGGFDSFGTLAFAISASPSNLDDTEVRSWMTGVFAGGLAADQTAKMRRLLFEAQNLSISDMRSRVEPQSDISVRAMPVAERVARQQALEKRVTGHVFSPETLPAHSVVDNLVKQLDEGVLQYMPAYRFISRAQESQLVKKDHPLLVDSEGNLKVSKSSDIGSCDTSSDLSLRAAWTRRALAYDLAGLCSFQVLEQWTHKCFITMLRPVPQGYSRVSLAQIIAADRHLWTLASHNLMGNLTSTAGHEKPLEAQIRTLADHPEVLQFLNALPAAASSSLLKRDSEGDPKNPKGKGGKAGKGNKGNNPKGGKGNQEPKKFSVPEGCVAQVEGKPVCFAYNMGQCRFKTNNKGRCARGFHVCWRSGCGEQHPGHECTKSQHQ